MRVGGHAFAALETLMHIQLEARQRGHDEEVAKEVAKGFFQQVELELRDRRCVLKQVRAHHGLMEIRCDLGHKQRIVAVDRRLILEGEIGVHGMAELVRQRAEAEQIVVIAHHDERMRARRSARKRAAYLALIRIHIHPAIVQAATAHGADVIVAQRRQPAQIHSTACS